MKKKKSFAVTLLNPSAETGAGPAEKVKPLRGLGFEMCRRLFGHDALLGANVSAGPAVRAFLRINHIIILALADRLVRTLGRARSAQNALLSHDPMRH